MKLNIKNMATLGVLLLLAGFANAQMVINIVNTNDVTKADSIDNTLFTVQYETKFMPDTLNPEKLQEETMMLKVGRQVSVYYSYAKYLTDSIIEVDKATGASMDMIREHLTQFSAKVSYKIYKNYPAGKVTFQDQLVMNRFICEEDNEIPKWQIHPDTATILSYTCRKATCHFKGRDYEAWFTMEIPRSEGPWKLNGLPGLILKAQDSREHYTFVCTGITQSRGSNPIMISKNNYEPISRKNLNRMYERFAADPVGYSVASAPNVTIKIHDESGREAKAPKNMPYNPIELD
ncbi:GLPGLI family protein [Bacteroides sp. 51]|uniref:GLPGLI family protein n=1 Tax=Bacteroides sp. 51 TaxID=2302938 RepID=UPI0013D6AE89|nr:GLPGLI family protein [Bacteroides sp. 51]NDV82649.1 GLPGLI family protein [Bacteroides sp. 51]